MVPEEINTRSKRYCTLFHALQIGPDPLGMGHAANIVSMCFDSDEISRRKMASGREDARLIAEGINTPQEIQDINSIILPGAKIKMDFEKFLRNKLDRMSRKPANHDTKRRASKNSVSTVS